MGQMMSISTNENSRSREHQDDCLAFGPYKYDDVCS